MGLKLITEQTDDIQILTEERDGRRLYFIEGIFLQGNQKNQNGRVYPVDLLEREVARYTRDHIKQNRALGELGHPNGPGINLDRASHLVESLTRDGDNFIGRAKVLDTPCGKIVQNLLEAGVKLGVSSRGVGSLRATGTAQVVQSDYYLATAGDIVAEPSAPEAFVQGILEGKEWVWDNGVLMEAHIDQIQQQFIRESKANTCSAQIRAFEAFLKAL